MFLHFAKLNGMNSGFDKIGTGATNKYKKENQCRNEGGKK